MLASALAASRAPARWVSRAFRLAAATAPADDPAACVSSSPEESKLFGLTGNDAVANTSSARQRQEGAGQTAHGAPRASPADDLLPGMAEKSPLTAAATDPAKHQVRYPLRPEHLRPEQCAPSRIRTCDLLLSPPATLRNHGSLRTRCR